MSTWGIYAQVQHLECGNKKQEPGSNGPIKFHLYKCKKNVITIIVALTSTIFAFQIKRYD